MTGPWVIDVHSHATFDPGDGLDAGLGVPVRDLPPWSADGSIELMDRVGIGTSILSMPESGVHHDRARNARLARQVNEFLVDLRAKEPTRRGAMAALPALDTDDALAELAYALDTLAMDAVSLPASVRDVYLGDPTFDPLFEEFERRRLTLFVHPTLPPAAEPLTLGLNQSILEFPFDTTRMIVNLILTGTLRRFPHVNVIATHGGGTLPFLLTRIQTLIPVFGAGPDSVPLTADRIAEDVRALYYDTTAATAPDQLASLVATVGADRLMAGFDIPFMPPASVAPAVAALRSWDGFDAPAREQVLSGTASRLFPAAADRIATTRGGGASA
jgi:6-methylsalicylate decarboxylase